MDKPFIKSDKQISRVRHKEVRVELVKYKLLIESILDYAIFLMDTEGYILTWNKGAERNKGYNGAEIIGKHFSIFYSDDDNAAKKPERELRIASEVGRIEDEDWRIRKDGTRFWANVVITALHDENGVLIGFAKVTRDLTERKRQEDEIRRANLLLRQQQQELKALNVAKDEFISLASHQLRTPSTAVKLILGSISEELYGAVDPELLVHIRKAYESNERQIQIVNSLLRVAQVDAGKVVLRREPTNISDLLADIIDEQSDNITVKQQTVEFIPDDTSVSVDIDRQNFRMAISNLIDNASKYSLKDGRIVVSTVSGHNEIQILIRDHGIGIAQDDFSRLFGKFQRLQQEHSYNVPGSGLGLFWAKKIVELHNGQIDVESEVGHGTTFKVTLPRACPDA